MVAPKKYAWSFRTVCAYETEKACVLAGHDETSELGAPSTAVFAWAGQWFNTIAPIIGSSVCPDPTPDGKLLAMGLDGRVSRWGTELFEETVDSSSDGPQHVGDLREIRQFADSVYVVGMGRTVYQRKSADKWARMDEGIRANQDEDDKGLNSIHGFSKKEVYAVGFDGEIWWFDGKKWIKLNSPTNSILYRIVCVPGDAAYAFGQSGVVLRGRKDEWEEVVNEVTEDTIWGATVFNGTIFASTVNGLFYIDGSELAECEVKMTKKSSKTKAGVSFYHLDANDTRIWSVGRKMVMWSEDGEVWTETPYE